MCVQNGVKTLIFLILLVFIGFFIVGCEAIDNIIPSSGSYKINVQINGVSVDECSYARSVDKITPYFEEPVTGDPDVTALTVFLKDSKGDIVGWKVSYVLDQEAEEKDEKEEKLLTDEDKDEDKDEAVISNDDNTEETTLATDVKTLEVFQNGNELIIPVLSLDGRLPSFPIPEDLSMGMYTMVSQVMSDKVVLQKAEKNIFYLGKNTFSYKGINTYLPGTGGTSQLIPRGMVVMLEVNLDFDKKLNPYIVWYEGKNKISEGNFSDGAELLFWKAPEQSGFFSLRAEVFPVERFNGVTGYKKEISLLVSSKVTDVHLASPNVMQLKHWYTMEGSLNDVKMPASPERALRPASGIKPKWMGLDGTYGLATGYKNILTLPKIQVVNKEAEIWQILFRLKPLNNGNIFSVQFGSSGSVLMTLNIEDKALVLKLISPLKTVSQIVGISASTDESSESVQASERDSPFLTVGVKFSIQSGLLTAQINIIGSLAPVELAIKPIALEAEIKNEFNIMLGSREDALYNQLQTSVKEGKESEEIEKSESSVKQEKTGVSNEYTALWDEFALYYMPPKDILAVTEKPVIKEDQPVTSPEN
jgi:hypothetical protein